VIGIVEDISKRKEVEIALEKYSNQLEVLVAKRTRDLEQAQEELIAKEKLATLGQLAGSVGHELRNLLGVINNATYILEANLSPENQKAREYVRMISSQVQRSNKIISDLLNFAREPVADKSSLSVLELITLILSNYPSPENVSIETNISQDLPHVYVDQQHIEQIMTNLLTNAYQAMPKGGRLHISAAKKKDNILISVEDSGVGISTKDKQKLFTPLFTTKASGIGLGLAISKKLVEANGGKIEVQSKPGRGSTFTIILPIAGRENGQ
jgi:signal transduction histidine kinase